MIYFSLLPNDKNSYIHFELLPMCGAFGMRSFVVSAENINRYMFALAIVHYRHKTLTDTGRERVTVFIVCICLYTKWIDS